MFQKLILVCLIVSLQASAFTLNDAWQSVKNSYNKHSYIANGIGAVAITTLGIYLYNRNSNNLTEAQKQFIKNELRIG